MKGLRERENQALCGPLGNRAKTQDVVLSVTHVKKGHRHIFWLIISIFNSSRNASDYMVVVWCLAVPVFIKCISHSDGRIPFVLFV